jgi:hypothetical protein
LQEHCTQFHWMKACVDKTIHTTFHWNF